MGKKILQEKIKYRAGALSLLGILIATFLHTMTFMSEFFYHNLILGGIAAFAIDAGVVAMAMFKEQLLEDDQLAWMVKIVTVLVLAVSGVANMSEGFRSAYGQELTYALLASMDPAITVKWLAGTIIFPVLAYVMCDAIGTRNLEILQQDRERQARKEARQRRAIEKAAVPVQAGNTLDNANAQKGENQQQRWERFVAWYQDHPGATITQIEKEFSCARGTACNWRMRYQKTNLAS